MRNLSPVLLLLLVLGCSTQRANTPSQEHQVKEALKQQGFDHIDVSEDREKGVITLSGHVATWDEKHAAQEVARDAASSYVVANDLSVTGGTSKKAEELVAARDQQIETRLNDFAERNNLKKKKITADVHHGVVTLTGQTTSRDLREQLGNDASRIEGVTKVVNNIEVSAPKKKSPKKARSSGQ